MSDEPETPASILTTADDYRAKLTAQKAEGRRRWLDYLDQEGFIDAEITIATLFDRDCSCGCHPKLPSSDLHDYGFKCSCTQTPEEREAASHKWSDYMKEYWESGEGQAEQARTDAEEAELQAWLVAHPGVVVTTHGGMCPEQWSGYVDGVEFYFRERHGSWRIETELVYKVEPASNVKTFDKESGELVAGKYHTSEGTVMAEGVEGCPGYGQTPAQRAAFLVQTIRDHYARQSCVHPGAQKFCPLCGERTAHG